jgi:hypothetical protein
MGRNHEEVCACCMVPFTTPTNSLLSGLQIRPAPELRRKETGSLKRGFYLE